jgi:hypothetical protein
MLLQRVISIIAAEELAADIRKAEAEAIRRGWLDDYRGDGTLELTEAGERRLSEILASPLYTRH